MLTTKKDIALRAIALKHKNVRFQKALHWYVAMMCTIKTKTVIALRAVALKYNIFTIRPSYWYLTMKCTIETKKVIALRAVALNLRNVRLDTGFTLVCCNDVYLQN